MSITVHCDCGKTLKLKDEAAGKKLRCPQCQAAITVPDELEVIEDEVLADDAWDEEPDDQEDYDKPARPNRRGGRGAKASRPRSNQGSQQSGLLIGLVIGAGVMVAVGVVVFLVVGRRGEQAPIANGQQPVVPVPVGMPPNLNTPQMPPTGNPQPAPNTQPVVVNPAPVVPAAPGALPPWVVLSNFKQTSNQGPFDKSYSIDYRITSGAPIAGQKYVLYVGQDTSGGFIEHYAEFDVTVQNQGTIPFTIGPGILGTGALKVHFAQRVAHQKWKKLSGDIKLGGAETAANRPLTVVQVAGAAAQGKPIAIANAKFGTGFAGQRALTLEFVTQQPLSADGYFFVIAKNPAGNGIEIDVTQKLRRAPQGEDDKIEAAIIGPGAEGQLTVHIEKRRAPFRSPFDKDAPEILSNSITTAN